jgi:ATP-dependent DNA helicase RecG
MFIESKTVEFKREYSEEIKKTVTAFANTDGGKIYIGINDDGSVYGINVIDDVLLKVTNTIRDSIRPDITMFTETEVEQIDGKFILIITIQRGTKRPYYIVGKGIRPEGVFVRQGSSTVPSTETAILNMIKETSGDRYEDARSINQQLTFNEASAYFAKKKISFTDINKKTLHLIGEDGMYTNLALLLSDQCTHTIKLAVFEGEKKAIFKERREFSGSVLRQIEETYDFIDRFNSTRAEFIGLDRIDMRDYPSEAIRESLLNAIVHREYAYSGSILISIFDNRLEIVTIGGLVNGISLDDIMLGISILRNQHLATIFYRLKLIEAYGTGIPKIMNSYDEYKDKPQIETTDNAFKVILPNTNSKTFSLAPRLDNVLNEREKQVLSLFNENRFIIRSDVEMVAGVSQSTAITLLRNMIEKGLIKKIGSGKLVKYSLV